MYITPQMKAVIDSGNFRFEWLLWVKAKNRSTGALEASGVHTGLDSLTVTIDGEVRTYEGAGQVIQMPEFISKQGLTIESHEVSLAILSPEITNMIRAYDSDLAPADVYLAIFDKDEQFAGATQVLKGFVNGIQITGGTDDATCEIKLSSNIQEATRGLTLKKSNQSQKLIDATDEGFKYASIAGTTDISWGSGEGYRYGSMRGITASVTRPLFSNR